MATVKRLTKTRWYVVDTTNPKGRREVRAGTPGAEKVQELENVYYIVWKEKGRTKREATGLTDKRAAQAYLAEWNKAKEHGRTGILDPYKKHLDRSIQDHLAEYLKTITGLSDQYQQEVRRVLKIIFAGMTTLRDLTRERVVAHLAAQKSGAVTRGLHRSYVGGFLESLYKDERIPKNWIDTIPVPKEGKDAKPIRRRRRYTVDELTRLLKAAREYPLAARERNTGGRPRKDGGKAQPRNPCDLKPEFREQLIRQGKERELVYRLLLATGLRRGELSRVTVRMFDGKRISAPKQILKVKPEGISHVTFRIVPSLANDLSAFIKDTGLKSDDRLVKVPTRRNYLREHKARLKMAGIEYQTEKGFADIHAFRMTLNMILKKKEIEDHLRSRCLRHAAKGMTDQRYDSDTKEIEVMTRAVYKVVSKLDRRVTHPPAEVAD